MISHLSEQDVATKAWKGSRWRGGTGVIVNKQAEAACAVCSLSWQAQGPGLSKQNPVGPQEHKVQDGSEGLSLPARA